jgi:PPIC-type PPIASE domain
MRRFVIPFLLSAGVTGCSDFRELFTAHAEVAAEAGAVELPAERLAQIMTSAKGARISRDAANFVANIWLDYTLLAQAAVRDELPADSAAVAEVLWPEIAELRGIYWHDTLMARRSTVAPTAADSLYHRTDQRLLQHILIGVRQNAEPAVRAEAKKKAQATLSRLNDGENFSRLAAQLSEDAGSRPDSGFLPLGPRGRFVAEFDSAAWGLDPGEMTGLVETPYGYHIIKRPTLPAVRKRLEGLLVTRAEQRLDSLYMDSLATTNEVRVASNAPAIMREAAEDPQRALRSGRPLVNYKGGALTVREYLRWVRALPPQYTSQLRQADDSTLRRFARILTQNVLLLRQADSAGIQIPEAQWDSLMVRYRAQLDTLQAEIGLRGPDVSDPTAPVAEREQVAARRVEDYFNRLIGGKSRLRPMPSALATLLRERYPHEINDAGLNRAVELASQMQSKTDSAAPAPGAMQRAPGGPPIPGGGAPPVAPPPGATPPAAEPEEAK